MNRGFLSLFFRPKLKPIKITIESVAELSGPPFRTTFEVRFKVGKFYFNTTGTFDAPEKIDEQTLTRILETTDQLRYVDLNMEKRERGYFDYKYRYKDDWLLISYAVF